MKLKNNIFLHLHAKSNRSVCTYNCCNCCNLVYSKAPSTRIRIFSNPQLTATVHTYPANSTANPEKNKSALQSDKKFIRNESDNVWTGLKWKNNYATNPITCGRVNPDIFLSDDVKSVSRHNLEGEQSKFPATISLYGACSEDTLVQRSLGY